MFGKKQDVHIGRDGWLFLVGGPNRVMDRYRGTLCQWRLMRAWTRLITARAARANRLGIFCLHVVVPEKLSIYENMTDGLRYDVGQATTRRLARHFIRNPIYLDLVGPLRAGRDGPVPLYLRTDTHWTIEGCLLAYREIMQALGAHPPADIATRPRIVVKEVMDLGIKLPHPPKEFVERITLLRDAIRVEIGPLQARYETQGRDMQLHVGAHVVYRNKSSSADQRKIVMFGDSCAHFSPFLLTGLLAESFYEVHFIWSSDIDWDYVDRVRPEILLFELAERFLTRIPVDNYDVNVAGRRGTLGRLGRV